MITNGVRYFGCYLAEPPMAPLHVQVSRHCLSSAAMGCPSSVTVLGYLCLYSFRLWHAHPGLSIIVSGPGLHTPCQSILPPAAQLHRHQSSHYNALTMFWGPASWLGYTAVVIVVNVRTCDRKSQHPSMHTPSYTGPCQLRHRSCCTPAAVDLNHL